MKNSEYNINIYSRSRLIIAMSVILCSSLVLIENYNFQIGNKFLSIIQFIIVYAISIYLASLIAIAKIKVIFTEDLFIHVWKRRFLLSREKNIEIPWNMINSFGFESDRTFDSLVMNLSNKTQYKIGRLNILPAKDDFKKLEKEFIRLSNKKQKSVNLE